MTAYCVVTTKAKKIKCIFFVKVCKDSFWHEDTYGVILTTKADTFPNIAKERQGKDGSK